MWLAHFILINPSNPFVRRYFLPYQYVYILVVMLKNTGSGPSMRATKVARNQSKGPKTQIASIKPKRDGFSIAKVVAGAIAGLFVGGAVIAAKQVATVSLTPTTKLDDPPCPEMEAYAGDMADEFRNWKGPFHKICPERRREYYESCVREAIRSAEYIMVVQTQMRNGELTKNKQVYVDARQQAIRCIAKLKKARDCFDSEFIKDAHVHINNISQYLSEQLQNVHNQTDDIYPGVY
jgi:hypothetical protein